MLEQLLNTEGFNGLVKAKHGYLLYNKHDRFIGRSIEKYGEFSEWEIVFFRQLIRPGDIVVEVGANIGTHTLPLASLVGKAGYVYAFEPQRVVFQTLCGNMALNSVENVDCRQLVASSAPGVVWLPNLRYDLSGNFGGLSLTNHDNGYPVTAVRLDDVLKLPQLNFLKIDVEGMELDVLQGSQELIKKHRPSLYVENDRIDKSRRLIEFIMGLDYRLFWHLPPMYNPNNFAADPEDIFPGLFSDNMFCVHRDVNLDIRGCREILDPDSRAR